MQNLCFNCSFSSLVSTSPSLLSSSSSSSSSPTLFSPLLCLLDSHDCFLARALHHRTQCLSGFLRKFIIIHLNNSYHRHYRKNPYIIHTMPLWILIAPERKFIIIHLNFFIVIMAIFITNISIIITVIIMIII